MNEQNIREIAETAFKARFGEVKVVRVNVRPRFDHDDDPVVDVNIIYDGKYEQLNPAGLLRVRSEVVSKHGGRWRTTSASRWSTSSPSPTSGGATLRRSDAVATPTRESVRLLITGARGPGSSPPRSPIRAAGTGFGAGPT